MRRKEPTLLSKIIMIICLNAVICSTSWATCEETKTALKKCDTALNITLEELGVAKELIEDQDDLLVAQAQQITDLKDPPFYENKFLWGLLGVVLGGFVVTKIKE